MDNDPTQQQERIDSVRRAKPLDPDQELDSSDKENITLIDEQTEEAEIEFELIQEQQEFMRREGEQQEILRREGKRTL